MYKIGIMGTENSHAMAFAERLNVKGQAEGFAVTALGGNDPEASKKITETCGDMTICTADEMAENCDAVMVTARDGAYHMSFIMPAIKKGLPVFIDKPFTRSSAEAELLFAEAAKSGSVICGGSGLKFAPAVTELADIVRSGRLGKIKGGSVYAPVNMKNDYGDFWFYSQHLIDMAGTVFGYDVKSVSGIAYEDTAEVTFNYEDFSIDCHYNNTYEYNMEVIGENGSEYRDVDTSTIYDGEVSNFCEMVRSGRSSESKQELTAPVYIIEAIIRAFASGKTEPVRYWE